MRKKIPERNMEPPENYDSTICDDCKEDECLLDLICNCPEVQKAEQQAHAESLERKLNPPNFNNFIEAYDTFIAEQAQREEPTEEEKERARQRIIDFDILEEGE